MLTAPSGSMNLPPIMSRRYTIFPALSNVSGVGDGPQAFDIFFNADDRFIEMTLRSPVFGSPAPLRRRGAPDSPGDGRFSPWRV